MNRDYELSRSQAAKKVRRLTGVGNPSNAVLIRFFDKTDNNTFIQKKTDEEIRKAAEKTGLLEAAKKFKETKNKDERRRIKNDALRKLDEFFSPKKERMIFVNFANIPTDDYFNHPEE